MKLSPIKLFIYYLLQFTWGIIQNVIGLLLWIILFIINPKRKHKSFYGAFVCIWKFKESLSLGVFIFLAKNDNRLLVHEYGHSIQSMILGPLYILIIGIPSFIYCICFNSYRTRHNKNYYRFYTERWANILGSNITHNDVMEV